jgi:HPt (histidine-containing phosphotransfer) domain-containing protein
MINNTNNFEKISSLHYLNELSNGNAEFVKEMIGIFLSENPEEIQVLEKGIMEKDYFTIKHTAHKLRSSIPFVGLNQLIEQEVLEIEELAAERSNIQKIKTLFSKVKEVCLKTNEELKTERNELYYS